MMEEQDPTERRTHPRVLAPYRLPVYPGGRVPGGGAAGFLQDISREGMCVRFLSNVNLVDVDRLRLELPFWLETEPHLELPGRFGWFKEPEKFRGTVCGFAFDPLPDPLRRRVDNLIEGILKAAEEDGLLSFSMSEYLPATGSSLF